MSRCSVEVEVIRIEMIGAAGGEEHLAADAGSNSNSERKMSSERIVSTARPVVAPLDREREGGGMEDGAVGAFGLGHGAGR